MQSFFVTLFSVLQRITQQIQREFDRSLIFFLSFLSVFICFKGLLCDASENMAHCRGLGQIIAGKRWRRARLLQPPQPQTPAVSSDASLTEKSRIQTSPGTFLSKWLASSTFGHLKQCSRASSHEASIHPTFISWEEQAFAWINRDIIMFAYMTVTIFFLFFFLTTKKEIHNYWKKACTI